MTITGMHTHTHTCEIVMSVWFGNDKKKEYVYAPDQFTPHNMVFVVVVVALPMFIQLVMAGFTTNKKKMNNTE